MTKSQELVEIWRGGMVESVHHGHAVICDASGQIVESWGDSDLMMYPRSSCKMIQALPLVESGAAAAYGLTPAHLALACASHEASATHTDKVGAWLSMLGLGDDDFRCGAYMPGDRTAREALIRAGQSPCQIHNECSGKHAGFLTANKHLGGHAEYDQTSHPVQMAFREALEELSDLTSPGYGIDGCSAPNYATSLHGLARAMAFFASAHTRNDVRSQAAVRLREAMMQYPEMVAGERKSTTAFMRACGGHAAVKSGAEGVFVAILPEQQLGVALKISDGATRAASCAMAAILIRLGVLDAASPAAQRFHRPAIFSKRNLLSGHMAPARALFQETRP